MAIPDSTLTHFETWREQRASVWGRRVFLSLLLVVVLAGLVGLLGVRSTTATARGDGYELSVHHASIARPGLDVPLQATVTHAGGFAQEITLAVSGDYFDLYETQGFTPEPSESVRDDDFVYLTFDAPDADTFTVDYDAYIQPTRFTGQGATVSLVDGQLDPIVSVDITTWLMP